MTYYAVIDTNILVSALLSKHDDAATVLIINRMISGEIIPVYSEEILKEYQDVLNRKKFKTLRKQFLEVLFICKDCIFTNFGQILVECARLLK